MERHDFDWFADRLAVAQWKHEDEPTREGMFNCPVCGGHDPLSIKERDGRDALVHCFANGCTFREIIDALEEEPVGAAAEEIPVVPVVTRRRVTAEEARKASPEPAGATVEDPMAWYAAYCGVSLDGVPVRASADGWLEHYWDTTPVVKCRKAGTTGKDTQRRWVPAGAAQPRMWPTVPDQMPEEVWLAEGETDVIVLRQAYGLDAYTAGSASQPLTPREMKALKKRGVERVVVAYDTDREGQKATKATLESAKEAGLGASVAVLGDTLTGGPKDWRERWLGGDESIPVTEASFAAQEVWRLDEVPPAATTELLLHRLHPDDHTILFGDGGAGKGVVAAWWITRLIREDEDDIQRVLIVDYEEHARHEWRPRVERFASHESGDVAHVMERVHLYQPEGPIWDEAAGIFAACEELGVTYVVVDSVTYACMPDEVEKSVTAVKYTDAIKQFKRPTLSLAHTTKADGDPKHPFGSVFWSNGARITIAMSMTGGLEDPRKLETKKANQGGSPRPTQIEWGWVSKPGPVPTTLTETDVSTTDMAAFLRVFAEEEQLLGREPTRTEMKAAIEAATGTEWSTTKVTTYDNRRIKKGQPGSVSRKKRGAP